ncbi:MAG TPA: hypothetical protein VGH64_10010 [Puia sp.]
MARNAWRIYFFFSIFTISVRRMALSMVPFAASGFFRAVVDRPEDPSL